MIMTITPEEARRLVAKYKERGLIIAPVEQPTIEPKRRVFNRLSTIECDQCHQPFEQTSPTQKRCKGQCSVKARSARTKQWLTDHGMRGFDLGSTSCTNCGKTFAKKTRGHCYCSEECRLRMRYQADLEAKRERKLTKTGRTK